MTRRFRRPANWLWHLALLVILNAGAVPEPVRAADSVRPAIRVLFIGNSYTYFNNLPDMVAAIAAGLPAGPKIEVGLAAHGSRTLGWHLEHGDAISMLRSSQWDYVVLQEQSLLGGSVVDGRAQLGAVQPFHDSVRQWAGLIREVEAEPVLLLTWARQNPLDDHESFQRRLGKAYEDIAQELKIRIAPVGSAWAEQRSSERSLALYLPDGSHPAALGSYLTACVIYATVSGLSPVGAPARLQGRAVEAFGDEFTMHASQQSILVDAPVALALDLQQSAWRAVFESTPAPGAATSGELALHYARAAEIHNQKANGWHLNTTVMPHWLEGTNRFWFQEETREGYRFTLVNAIESRSEPAFDHEALARELTSQAGIQVDVNALPVFKLWLDPQSPAMTFEGLGRTWRYDRTQGTLQETGALPERGAAPPVVSPDGSKEIFRRDYDLWLRQRATGEEIRLTTDGEKYYAYGTVPHATGRPEFAVNVIWSPDSSMILTHQTDERQVADLPLIDYVPADGTMRPKAVTLRSAFPGDPHVPTFRMVIIDVAARRQIRVLYQNLAAVRMLDSPIAGNRAWWSEDSSAAYLVDIERYEKLVNVLALDAGSGRVRQLFSESTGKGYIELGSSVYSPVVLLPLPRTKELVWYSERSGWGHLYLYSLETGKLIRQLTSGDWLVRDVIGIDQERRDLFLTRAGYDGSADPYHRQVIRANLDSGRITVLSGSDADHYVVHPAEFSVAAEKLSGTPNAENIRGLSPTGDYYLESIQRIDRPVQTLLRDRNGREVMTVIESDTSQLPDWYRWPEPVQLVAADGTTPISAVVFRPSSMTPGQKYPVIDHVYGGPQVSYVPEIPNGNVGIRTAALAELGFVTVIIDGRGTAQRSRAFHETSYGAIQEASNLEDHIAAIKQLAERYPYIDASRVGIFGFSGGGYLTALAMMRHPEFYRVGVAGAGNYDQRLFWATWGERYHGPMEEDRYASQAVSTYASGLQGKLLFMHGLMDLGVHPSALFQLTQALMDANKDFDTILLPKAGHSSNGWTERQLWAYFLRHLAGVRPLEDYALWSVYEAEAQRGKKMQSLRYGEPVTLEQNP